jgi:hypothetical protein
MKQFMPTAFLVATIGLVACSGKSDSVATESDAGPPAASADKLAGREPGARTDQPGKIGGPVSVSYQIIGQPVVGQPLAIDLRVTSALSGQPVRVDYRIVDASALRLADSQSPYATVAAGAEVTDGNEQVRVVPLREGRLYLNVAATVDTDEGSISTVTAIPIQVGNAPREVRENGTLKTDENGDSVRVLSGREDD